MNNSLEYRTELSNLNQDLTSMFNYHKQKVNQAVISDQDKSRNFIPKCQEGVQ